ncbi:thiamine-phosphate diphosphorylase [Marinobacter salinus]|uniref:Thiamine-phosphate synthase n=1 Tax=Marinobacter salinus TaxID=1874317 RepID=A0A1D9GMT5_9GAMM|nr:thiamine phosphate synthase [Marinobacter salinus]AOY88943.1 thiamine-phosphate diphosphorylase [Marinobacter salinus]
MSLTARPGLYAVTDSRLTPPDLLLASVEAALRGGAILVQYREKSAPMADRLRQALDLQAVCRNAGVPLLINDDVHLARRSGAAGVHLGQTDGSQTEARHILGEEAIIGITCHGSIELAETADAAGATYLAFGRFYSSGTKPGAPAASPSVLTNARQFRRPLTAIGGITVDNGEPLIRAGADMLAVVGGLFGGSPEDIERRAKAFTRLFQQHHPLFSLSR